MSVWGACAFVSEKKTLLLPIPAMPDLFVEAVLFLENKRVVD